MKSEAKTILEAVKNGSITVDEALLRLKTQPFDDLGFAKVDMHRSIRQGAAEVIYGAGKTPAQIILRWHIQDGYITIPGSSNPEHIKENFDIFDFELSDEDMKRIQDLDRQERYENW